MRHTEPDKYAARAALTEFMDGWKKGDKEQMLDASLLELTDELEGGIEGTDSLLDYMLEINVVQYEIGEATDLTEHWENLKQESLNQKELIYYRLLEQGETEKAEQFRITNNEWLAFYSQCDMAYSFPLKIRFPEMLLALFAPEEIELTEDGYMEADPQVVVRYNGEWRVAFGNYLVPTWDEENNEKLEAYREKYGPVEFPID